MSGAAGEDSGGSAYLGYNSGTYATPVHVEIKKIGDVTLPAERATSDKDTRETPNTKTTLGNMKYSPIAFPYFKKKGTSDAVFNMLQDSYRNGSVIDLFALDDEPSVSGATGYRGPFKVSKIPRNEPVNDSIQYDVEMVEVDHEEGGAPVCTEPYTVA